MQSQMNRMFNEMLGNLAQSPACQLEGVTEWAPAVDATTKDGNLVIRAELPGVKPEDVDISLQAARPRQAWSPLRGKNEFTYDAEKDLYTPAPKARSCAGRVTTTRGDPSGTLQAPPLATHAPSKFGVRRARKDAG
jgi:hypothetical protein